MKDFDAIRQERYDHQEREFKIGGETFRRRVSVRPEEIAAWEDLSPLDPALQQIKVIDEAILSFIDDDNDHGSHERYRHVRQHADPPVGIDDIQDLLRWLIEANADRPTGQPADSSRGQENGGTNSMGGSFSPEIREEQTV